MSVNNYFKVFGKIPAPDGIFPTSEDDSSSDYNNLYNKGLEYNTVAKSQDVLTPLRELSIICKAFLDWLASQELTDIDDFKDAEIGSTDEQTADNVDAMVNNIKNALIQAINSSIGAKENTIPNKSGVSAISFLKYDNVNGWSWDSNNYQQKDNLLDSVISYYGTGSNEGFMYKKSGTSGSSAFKTTDNPFVYFKSETQDESGNYILNLGVFDYTDN